MMKIGPEELALCFTCFTSGKQIISISAVRSPFLLAISSFYTWYALLIIHTANTTLPSRWSCPLPGFRLMTSDSPLRGASCLQSAVRLLVIIFQSVTLVSALWRWERREDGGPAGWMAEAECKGRGKGVMFGGGQHCVYVCICVQIEVVVVG